MEEERAALVEEIVEKLDAFEGVIPLEMIELYMQSSGIQTDDEKVKKLFALAGQKFISDIAKDALEFCRLRQKNMNVRAEDGNPSYVLTLDDLTAILKDMNINLRKSPYFADKPLNTSRR